MIKIDCRVVELLYSYGITRRLKDVVLVDKNNVLAACKKLGIDSRTCYNGFEALKERLGFEEVLAVELQDEIIIESDHKMLAKKLSTYVLKLIKAERAARKITKLRRVDDALSIWRRIKRYYAVNEDRLLEYWFSQGLECGATLVIQTPKYACLTIAGLLLKDSIPWSTFQRLMVNTLYSGLESCYTLYKEYSIDDESIDALLERKQHCVNYSYELIVIEVKSRDKYRFLSRGGEHDPIAQLKRYIEKVVEVHPGRKNVLGLLVTNGFAARQLLTDFISESQRFRSEISRHGLGVRLDIVDFLVLYEILEECNRRSYADPPAIILQELLKKRISFAKRLLDYYEPPRNAENAKKMYREYRRKVKEFIRKVLEYE